MIGEQEKEFLLKLMPFWNDRPVVFDVGSNKGNWADVVLEQFGDNATIHLFEPVKILLDYTRIKYEYQPNIVYNRYAAFRHGGTERPFFYFENFNNELSSLHHGKEEWADLPVREGSVPTIAIADYADRLCLDTVDCIKIDCEGGDEDAFLGCEKLLRENRCKFFIIEYSHHYKRANSTFGMVIKCANSYGYKVYKYSTGNFRLVTADTFVENYEADNFIITKENIINQSEGWNTQFILNTLELGSIDMFLEIGCFEGITSRYVCENLLNKGGRVICVDPLEEYYTPEDTEHIEMFKGQHKRFLGNTKGFPITLFKKRSEDAFEDIQDFRFDLVFVDGDHSREAVYRDGEMAFKVCKNDGWILFDDYEWRDCTKEGIDDFIKKYAHYIRVFPKGYQMLVQKITDP
jgi:FkbM family methyltransferase